MGSRIYGGTAASLSPTLAGGRRSAWLSTGSPPPSWLCCSPSASTSTTRTQTTDYFPMSPCSTSHRDVHVVVVAQGRVAVAWIRRVPVGMPALPSGPDAAVEDHILH